MSDGHWKVTLHFNGRKSGRTSSTEVCENSPMYREAAERTVDELEREAVLAEGSIFVRGWEVEWVEAPLEDTLVMQADPRRYYDFIVALARNERVRAAQLPPGPEREDAKGWARDLHAHARKLRAGR